jgi:mRNA interferase MazF
MNGLHQKMRRRGVDFKPFDIVVVPFPFTDKLADKRRPALIVSDMLFNEQHDHLILAMITTAKNSLWKSDIDLNDWKTAKLTVPCKVRFKLFTLDRQLITRRLGFLSKSDKEAVKNAMKLFLATD